MGILLDNNGGVTCFCMLSIIVWYPLVFIMSSCIRVKNRRIRRGLSREMHLPVK